MRPDIVISVDIDAKGVKRGAGEAKASLQSIANVDFSALNQRLQALGPKIKEIGNGLRAAGQALTIGLTAPLTALATFGVKAALEIDKARTKIGALVGGSEAATKKLAELNALAESSVGVTRAAARETYAQLKGIGDIGEESINRVITSMGKLNAAFTIDDQGGFLRNIVQLFKQGFEIADLKEALGRVPIFDQIIEQAFGTKDPEKLKALKASGKLTLDTWLDGLSNAINNDPRIRSVQENLSTKLAKGWERLNESLAPLGEVILQIVVPALEALVPYIQRLADWFNGLSPAMKTAVVVFGAVVAAIGPVLIAVGAVVGAIGTLIASAGTIGIALLALIGIIVQIGPILAVVAAEVYVLYQAWQSNFGGIRDFTLQTWEAIKATIQSGLDAIRGFWQTHGAQITATVSEVWGQIKNIAAQALAQVENIVRLVLSVIRGDWAEAWKAILAILENAAKLWATLVSQGFDLVMAALFSGIPRLVRWNIEFGITIVNGIVKTIGAVVVLIATLPQRLVALVPTFVAAGKSIASAIWEGIKAGLTSVSGSAGGELSIAGGDLGGVLDLGGLGSSNSINGPGGGNGGISETAQQAKDLRQRIKDLNLQIQFFGDDSLEAAERQRQLSEGIKAANQSLADQAIGLAKVLDLKKADAEAAKKADEANKRLAASLEGIRKQTISGALSTQFGLEGSLQEIDQQIALGRDLNEVEKQTIANMIERRELLQQLTDLGVDLNSDEAKDILAILDARQKDNLELLKSIVLGRQKIDVQRRVTDLSADMAAEIADLNVRLGINSVLTEENRIRQLLLTDAYKGLKEAQQKKLIEDAKQIDVLREAVKAQEEAQRAYDDFFHTIRDGLDAARGGFRNFFSWVKDRFTQFLNDLIAEWLTSKFFDMFFKGGNQRVAQQNGQGSGGILGSIFGSNGILGSIFGSGSGSGGFGGFGGTPGFNPGYFNSTGGLGERVPGSINMTLPNGSPSSGGGLFGGGLSGAIGTIGSIGVVAGGLIGGRAGSLISNVAGGALAGLAIGGPIGAAIGAGVGFFASLFGGDPKRKRDKKEKVPLLNKNLTDALAQLRQLIVDTRTLRVSPDAALSRAIELRSAIASGFDIQFESKKYRRQAQTMIASKLREADALIAELRTAAEIARAASERDRRILPEFAKGVYLSPAFQAFRRQNGMLAGQWTGRDTIPAMLARGEMVLNPHQQDRVRSNAGFDVFKTAGIPGYAAGGVVTGQPSIQPVLVRDDQPITVQVSVQQDATGMFSLSARSPQGRKVLLEVVGDGFRNDEVKTKRR